MSPSRDEIKRKMSELLNQPVNRFDDKLFLSEIIQESMMLAEMIMELEDVYDVKFSQESLTTAVTVGTLCDVIIQRASNRQH
jgi:acyl carrier protein